MDTISLNRNNIKRQASAVGGASSLELGSSRVRFGPSAAHYFATCQFRRRGGLVLERRTPEREVGGSILTVLYP